MLVCSGFAPACRSGKHLSALQERWPSGLRRTLGKRVCVKAYRGFESHSLRQHRSSTHTHAPPDDFVLPQLNSKKHLEN